MDASWYMLHIRPQGKKIPVNGWPLVGQHVAHQLGKPGADEERLAADKKSPFWLKFQDDARPTWAPDFLRLGYAIVFRREGLPKLAVKLDIKNPAKLKKDGKDPNQPGPNGKRILTFDDVYAIGVIPSKMPMYCPDVKLKPEAWWLDTKSSGTPTSPYLAPGGATVAVGAQRLADIVVQMLRTPNGYPRPLPVEENIDDYSEFINPLVPLLPKGPGTTSDINDKDGAGAAGTDMGYAGMELFRY